MSSSKYHKYEKWFYRFLFSFIALIIPTAILYFFNNKSPIYFVVSVGLKLFLLASIVTNLLLVQKSKKWMAQGRELANEIGLKRLIVLDGKLPSRSADTRVIEIHHNLGPLSDGKVYSKRPRKEVIDELKEELKEDWRKLAEWKKESKQDILIITTTHPAMKKIWERTCNPYFYFKKSDRLLDPYVGMNLLEWVTASYSTSGKVDFRPPKQWDSYYIYIAQNQMEDKTKENEEE